MNADWSPSSARSQISTSWANKQHLWQPYVGALPLQYLSFPIYTEAFFPSDSLQQFRSSSVIWPNPSLSFLPPPPLSSPLCVPYAFPFLWLVFKATHLINIWSGCPWWLGSWLLPNTVCNRDGWMAAIPFMDGLIWFLNSFPLLK